MQKQSYHNTEEEDPWKFVLQMPQSIRVNLVCRGALVLGFGKPNTIRYYLNQYLISVYIVFQASVSPIQ